MSEKLNIEIKFGSTLKTIRKQNNRTQKEVAQFLGLSTMSYSRYEQDLRQPDFDTLAKLAILFDVDMGRFFFDSIYFRAEERNMEFEIRLNEKYIDDYEEFKNLDTAIGQRYNTERRSTRLIARVNTIINGGKSLPGELDYLEKQLKSQFKEYQFAIEMIENFGGSGKIDDDIVKTLNDIQEYNSK